MNDSEIQNLLEEDKTRAHRSFLLLRELRPSTPECFDMATRVYASMHKAFDSSDYERGHSEVLTSAARALGIGLRELTQRFNAEPNDVAVREAMISDGHLRARLAQKVTFQLAWRAFRWAATDLRRLRVTAVYGFQRQQAEAVGLMDLFREDHEIAMAWLKPTLKKSDLFRKTQPKLKARLDRLELKWAYDHGSAASIHASFASAAAGARLSVEGEHHLTVEILDDEVNDADPYLFHLAAGSLLRTQQRVLSAVLTICPDITTPELSALVQSFGEAVEGVWWTLTRRYGPRIAALTRLVPPSEISRPK